MTSNNPYVQLFNADEDVEPPPVSSPPPVTLPPMPMPRRVVPVPSSVDGSMGSYNSYPSVPASTPPTSKAEWTQAKTTRKTFAPRQNGRLEARFKDEAANADELNAHLSERVSRNPNAHPRPVGGFRDQAKLLNQFHSNLVEMYLQHLNDKPRDGSWLDAPEVPTAKELLDQNEAWTQIDTDENGNEQVFLYGNKLKGPWDSDYAYLYAHFGMLREEAVRPLREAISWVKAYPHAQEDASTGSGISVYTKVHITTFTFSTRGLGIRVVFSLSKVGKKVRWEQSKRLLSGSLVVLTPTKDLFRTKCIVATVAARPLDLVQEDPPKIDLFFSNPEDIDIDPSIEYTMIEERSSFFEAVRHIGVSLQKMTREDFPLKKHIVEVNTVVPPPKYILDRPNMDLRTVFEAEGDRLKDVDVLKEFPKDAKTTLDASQQVALSQIFKRRVALIQGPPGTGKTHVSVMALKLLIRNMQPQDPPIVVACQTNHALDQLLRHVAGFEENFVRLGGRSKDQGVVRERTLYNVLQKQRVNVPGGMKGNARSSLRSLEESMLEVLAPLDYSKDQSTTGFMQLDTYRKAGILTEKQCKLLEAGDQEWAGLANHGKTPLAQWLGKYVVQNERHFKPDDHLNGIDFEEADLEFEQLREIEAENICQDDEKDFESLSGNGFPIHVAYSGKHSDVGDAKIEEWLKTDNLWKIPARHRGAVFNYIQRKSIVMRNEQIHSLAARYDTGVVRHRYGGFENNAILLRQQKVVGVTTTGLSKYRGLISAICPRVIMIEEAAETMEPPVTAGCVPTLEHLILVGDHKQLRPQCGVKMLERDPYFLNVSMFERLIENKLPYKMLKRQRRMIPEIRRLLGPIYRNDIKDHKSMTDMTVRPNVPGMGGVNSFFYTHSWPDNVDDQMSATNAQEADMVVGFYDHLISNNLTQAEITVLTFYNGQRKLILRKLRNHHRLKRMHGDPAHIFKVLTVDSYQGEENEVVLLSLVRSNDVGKIGFLGVENRICVALSRAKRGFYMFGNAELLACESKLWAKVINIMLADPSVIEEDRNPANVPHGRVVWNIPLRCSKHGRKMYIEKHEDWENIAGGCDLPCGEKLPCGHDCTLACHPFAHDKTICMKPCEKKLACGHKCGRECHDACHCPHCGTKRLAMLETGGPISNGSETSESGGSNARAWQEFAKVGHIEHDASLKAMQQENYLQQQAKLAATPETAKYGRATPPPSSPEAPSMLVSRPPALLLATNGNAKAPLIDPSPLPTPVVEKAPIITITAPSQRSKIKVSHRDRFKKAAPSATPIITTPVKAPAVKAPAVTSAPPMGYTGMPSLQDQLVPQHRKHYLPVTPSTAVPMPVTARQINRFEEEVAAKEALDAAKVEREDLLIDFD